MSENPPSQDRRVVNGHGLEDTRSKNNSMEEGRRASCPSYPLGVGILGYATEPSERGKEGLRNTKFDVN